MEKTYTVYSPKEIMESSVKYFGGDELAANVWMNKYELRDGDSIFELEPGMMHRRLAKAVGIHLSDSYGGLFPTCYSCSQTELPARSDWSEGRSSSRYIPLSAIFEIKVSYDYNACDKVIKKYPLVSSISNNKYNSDSINYNSEAAVNMSDEQFECLMKCDFLKIRCMLDTNPNLLDVWTNHGDPERCWRIINKGRCFDERNDLFNRVCSRRYEKIDEEWISTTSLDVLSTMSISRSESNRVISTRLHGRPIDIEKVYAFIADYAVGQMEDAYQWVGVKAFLNSAMLLVSTDITDFEKQFSSQAWFGWAEKKPTRNAMSHYWSVPFGTDMLTETEYDDNYKKPHGSYEGYKSIRRIYDNLKDHYNESEFLMKS